MTRVSTNNLAVLPDPGEGRVWKVTTDEYGELQLTLAADVQAGWDARDIASSYVDDPEQLYSTGTYLLDKQNKINNVVGTYVSHEGRAVKR